MIHGNQQHDQWQRYQGNGHQRGAVHPGISEYNIDISTSSDLARQPQTKKIKRTEMVSSLIRCFIPQKDLDMIDF